MDVTSQNGRLEVAAAGLTLRGQVELPDRQDYSGVKVSAGSQTVTTKADGAFVLPLAAGQPYTLHLSAPGCLSLQVNGQPLAESGAFDLGRLVMLGGDATGDDRVDLADLSFVNSRLGSQDSQADLNGDQQVDKLDVAPILANYGRQGPIRMGAPVKPAGVISEAEMPPLTFAPQPNPHLVKLGQALFFDRILSGNRDIACSTCHLPGQNSSDGLALSIGTGATGGLGPARELGSGRSFIPRNALDIFNRGTKEWHTLFWDSRVSGSPETGFVTPARSALPPGLDSVLAVQAMFPVTSRDEMRGRQGDVSATGPPNELAALGDQDFTGIWAVLLARLLAIPEYVALFQAAYPDTPLGEFGFQHAANAIAAFEQDAFTFTNSPWDQYLAGDPSTLSEPAQRGADLFFGQAGCARCHAGNLFTDQEHHNLGVPQLGPGKGAEAPLDLGRARETKNPLDRFAFRTASLRNVTLTGPWMHNGAYTSLEDAVRHHLNPEQALRNYQANGLRPELKETVKIDDVTVTSLLMTLDPLLVSPPPLTDEDVADLLAFLAALTDPAAANLGDLAPASVPSGLPVDSETETEPVAVPAIEAIATPTTPPSPTNPFTATLTAHYSGELAREWMQLLYDRVQADKLSPPVAARIYAYGGITLYESVVAGMPGYRSMQGQLNELSELPQPGTEPYHWPTVAANAMTIVAEALFATADSQAAFAQLRDEQIGASSAEIWPAEALDRSTVYGQQLGQAIVAWLETDGYRETRDKSFTILTGPGRWTPVGDQKPLEPYWGDLRPLALSTPDACQPPAPEPFSTAPTSTFYTQANQVYEASQKLTSEQKAIALFWADTPGQTGTPPGHWVSIANQIIDQQQLNLGEAAHLHALLGIGLADAFISCWQEKYNTFLLRPVSYIQQHIDPDWQPLIPTPPFPEYPSGHSVASAAAAEIL
ncbi:MAG: hypothetical protein HC875_23975, partial [Anaerolineales bacterium]|nr:hypothetical protein [Anaerolineales bacterium]